MLRKNVSGQHVFFGLVNATTGAALTGASVAGHMGLDSAAQASVTGTFTELGLGQYRFDPSQADTNADYLGYIFTATSAIPVSANFITTGGNFSDGVRFGLTSLPNAAAAASGGLPTFGTGSGQITASSGQVTVGTNNDKTGYTVSTVSDKTGYSLAASQTFNVTGNITGNVTGSVGSVTGAVGSVTGAVGSVTGSVGSVAAGVTVTTNNDKTGYALTQSFPTNFSSLAITAGGAVTVGTVSDKTGYALTAAYDLAKTAAQAGTAMTLTAAYDLAKTAAQVGSAMTLDFTQAVPTSNTAQTVGDALNAARAQGFGKWVVSGTTLTLYASNGTTVVRTFTLDSATAPTSRT